MEEVKSKNQWMIELKKPLKLLGVIFLFALFIFAIILFGQDRLYANSLYPGTKIAGINLSELPLDQAQEKLEAKVKDYLEKGEIKIMDSNKSWILNPQDIGVEYDVEKSINSIDIHNAENYDFLRIKNLFGKTFEKPVVCQFDAKKLAEFITLIDTEASVPYQNASLKIKKSGIVQTQAKIGLAVDKIELKNKILQKIKNLRIGKIELPKNFISPKVQVKNLENTRKQVKHISQNPITLYNYDFDKHYNIRQNTLLSWLTFKEFLVWQGDISKNYNFASIKIGRDKLSPLEDQRILHLSYILGIPGIDYNMRIVLDEDKLNQFIQEEISRDLNQEPVNVKLAFSNGELKVIEPEKNGWRVDEVALKRDIEKAITDSTQYIKINLEEVLADARVDNLDELGIKKLLGTGVSSFAGSPRNRIHNIKLGVSKYNGILIKPDETFSFNKILGKVDASTGYLPELVIKANQTIPEYGGGLCQVSTTAFRAALNSGLPIVERKNHAYPVRYYKWPYPKYGTDATIYLGGANLRFRNDTGYWILIQTRVEGSKLFYDFFGNTDVERRVELDISEYGYGWKGSGSLKATVIYRVYEGDRLIREQKFQSNYKSPNDFPHPGHEEEKEEKKEEEKEPPPLPPSPPPEEEENEEQEEG